MLLFLHIGFLKSFMFMHSAKTFYIHASLFTVTHSFGNVTVPHLLLPVLKVCFLILIKNVIRLFCVLNEYKMFFTGGNIAKTNTYPNPNKAPVEVGKILVLLLSGILQSA